MKRFAVATSTLIALMMHTPACAEVTAERSDGGAVVKIDGQLFTEYLVQAGQCPAFWPVIGPTGAPMTRSYPVGPDRRGETTDHPHHQSIWFAHDRVNGADFWKANVSGDGTDGPHVAHRGFESIESDGTTARIVAHSDWMNGDKRICSDQRTMLFGARPNGDRWIDFTIVLKATEGDVTFGDTKEGTFAVRVADFMRLETGEGGRITNSDGQVNDAAWGQPAKWVDYTGPVDGETVGIAMMSHPKSFRPVPRWHVRGYGLFAANPFGEADFPSAEKALQGATTIAGGDSITLRYLLLFHRGSTQDAALDSVFEEFAAR